MEDWRRFMVWINKFRKPKLNMKNQLISGALFILTILAACGTKAKEKKDHYKIGSKEWHIEFPENYVSFANVPDTSEYNMICGVKDEGKTILLLKIQKDDTLWVEPIPNMVSVFLAPASSKDRTKQECVERLIKTYGFFIENAVGVNLDYHHKEKEVSIDGMDFIELENSLLDSTGAFSYGDIQYIGIISDHWMQIQLSVNNIEDREKLRGLVMNSKFK